MNALEQSIRTQFVRVSQNMWQGDDGGHDESRWFVHLVVGVQSFQMAERESEEESEWFGSMLAKALAHMIDALAPGTLPVEAPHLHIAAERSRQVMKGWTAEHDDTHKLGEMADAAAYYAANPYNRTDEIQDRLWPWSTLPPAQDRRTELVKAGALIVAELARLARAEIAKGAE